ncbi:hypothetical protein C8J57DRAFT_346782 [Mycena rebaudengoi]|nr:hypothetical protein C8J57DRAFT_346782 [Mycena rebaudengoi]
MSLGMRHKRVCRVPLPSFDKMSLLIIGPLLTGTWVNSGLYTVELIQVAYYFTHFPNDSLMIKLFVGAVLIADMTSMIAIYACVYLYSVTHWGELPYLATQNLPVPIFIFSTGLVASLVQSFLVLRYWRLSKNIYISLFLVLLVMVGVAGLLSAGIIIAIHPTYQERSRVRIPAAAFLGAEALTNVSISVALLWEFRKMRSPFTNTQSLLRRLASQSIQTGSAGATIAVAALIAYLVKNESNVPLGIVYSLGRFYCLTLLSNLNIRAAAGGQSKESGSSGNGMSRERSARADIEGGLHHLPALTDTHRPAVKVHIDKKSTTDSPHDVEIEMQASKDYSYSSKTEGLLP